MSIAPDERLVGIWEEIRHWPVAWRVSLAARILQSVEHELPTTDEAPASPTDLIGCWRIDNPPGDDEVERILEEERMRKHA